MSLFDPNTSQPTLHSSQHSDSEVRDNGLNCELVVYESKIDLQGRRVELEVKRSKNLYWRRDDVTKTDPALVVTKYYTNSGIFDHRVLAIRSIHMRKAVQRCVGDNHDIQHGESATTIVDSPYCLLYGLKALEDYRNEQQDPDAKDHVGFLLQYVEQFVPGGVKPYREYMESPKSISELDYDNLWMAFPPGTLVVRSIAGDTSVLSKVKRMRRCDCGDPRCRDHQWELQLLHIVLDGEHFLWQTTSLKLKRFRGTRRVSQLEICPLDCHPRRAEIRPKMISRGQNFLALKGVHHRQYEGMAWLKKDSKQMRLFKGRIMIDMKECLQKSASTPGDDNSFEVGSYLDLSETEVIELAEDGQLDVSDEDLATCSYKIPGFALSLKRWCHFLVDHIKEVNFDKKVFDSLILPPQQKALLRALVQGSKMSRLRHDNLIKDQGRGLVVLLHGAPGVGKTLTAESLADLTERPLYTITPGDLGVDVGEVENKLAFALAQAERWKALVLLDDVDVFVEERRHSDLNRNALVSIFLRLLERFEGSIFLTTNRVESMDRALLSRIHVTVQYKELDTDARHEIWKTSIAEADSDVVSEVFNDAVVKDFASYTLDGRQIKNCLRIALTVAEYSRVTLAPTHILDAIQALKSDAGSSQKSAAQVHSWDQEDALGKNPRSKRRRTNER